MVQCVVILVKYDLTDSKNTRVCCYFLIMLNL